MFRKSFSSVTAAASPCQPNRARDQRFGNWSIGLLVIMLCLPIAAFGRNTAVLSKVSCTSSLMTGAGTDMCTVTLTSAAQGRGVGVILSSSSAAVTVPAKVIVSAGDTGVEFTATVSPVGTAQTVTLTAIAGFHTESFTLNLGVATTTLTVSSSSSPSTYGSAVTFTAAISSGRTGTVTFYDGGTAIGTGAISGTTAKFTTNTLIAGSHTIAASWPGSSSYGAVTSRAITQVVNAATPAIVWNTPAAITYGTPLSGTQLDASSPIAGKFVYSPGAGTVLAAGSHALSVTFTPTNTTDYTTATHTVTLTVDQSAATLSINATSLAFGDVTVNMESTQAVTLTSTGTASVTVSAAKLTGSGFTISGVNFPLTLASGQKTTLEVQFEPTAIGAQTGQLSITSNSSANSTVVIALSGTGTAASYAVDLSWDAPASSADPIAGYNVYRAPDGSTTYVRLNSSIDTNTSYADNTVVSGQTYNYAVESVDASGVQSAPSNLASVTIP